MIKKDKWLSNYSNLDPDDQLIVADAIATELSNNEKLLDSEDGYDNEKSKVVRKFFELIRYRLRFSQNSKKYEEAFSKFESLSQKNQTKIIDEIFRILLKYIEIQEKENNEEICQKEGHIFGKWKHNEWIEYIDTVIDHQHIENYPEEYENWSRICKRCGLIEEVNTKPEELIKKKEENKIKRIKRLEKELQKLKSDN